MTPADWPCPLPGGGSADEFALTFDRARRWRLLVVPALFDEGNKLRRLTVEVMRRFDGAGIDSFLIDLPGLNESPQPLERQGVEDWQDAVTSAALHFGVTHLLGMRGGALFLPTDLPAWRYAPVNGAQVLRQMLRARIVAAREAGRDESQEGLLEQALEHGIELAGYRLGGDFVRQFQSLTPAVSLAAHDVPQDMVGGGGLWLRAEPGESREQADALAAIVAIGIKA